MSEDELTQMVEIQELIEGYDTTIENLKEALTKIELLTMNSSSGEIFRIHEIAKNALK
jgi:hypothetical protein